MSATEGGTKTGLAPGLAGRRRPGLSPRRTKSPDRRGRQHPPDFLRHLRLVEAGEGLAGWRARVLEQPLDFAGVAILHLRFGQMPRLCRPDKNGFSQTDSLRTEDLPTTDRAGVRLVQSESSYKDESINPSRISLQTPPKRSLQIEAPLGSS